MKPIFAVLLLIVAMTIQSQTIDTRKFIDVTGSAEMTVQPDEIELEITLGEFKKTNPRKMTDIEADFNAVLKKNGVKPESVKFQNTSDWYWWYWWNDREANAQTVRVTLNNKTDILKFVKDLDKSWTHNIRIVDTRHKDMVQFRKTVKIEAMKAAKEKASYLLESVGEKPGGILAVEEMPEQQNYYWYNQNLQSQLSNSYVSQSSGEQAIDNAKALKIRYEVKVKFEIQ